MRNQAVQLHQHRDNAVDGEGTRDPQVARMEFFLCQPVEYTIAMLEAHAVVQPNPSMLFSGGYHARLHAARGSRR